MSQRMPVDDGVFQEGGSGDYDQEEDMKNPGEGDLPPDFIAHAKVALGTDDPEAIQALYDAIEACSSGGGSKGLDVVIGMGRKPRR